MKNPIPAFGLVAFCVCAPAWADFIPISEPNAAYLSETTLVPFIAADGTVVSFTTDGTQVLNYSTPLTEFTAPSTWSTWNVPPFVETSTPRVGSTGGATSLTINLSIPANTFGVEVEPNVFQVNPIAVEFFTSGGPAGTIDLSVNGFGGARLFAAMTDTSPFTSVTITDLASNDFAIAQQRYGVISPVPEPSSGALIAAVLSGMTVLLRLGRTHRF